jgi:hypothetical protein
MDYISVSDPRFDKIASMMPECCILEIHEIEKDYNDFDKRNLNKKTLKLFHGTKHSVIHSIIEEGLKTSYNKISAYGKGVYFSPNVNFSMTGYTDIGPNDMSYVFLCDVIEQEAKKCNKDIYVCEDDNSHRIRYLISFYKLAN